MNTKSRRAGYLVSTIAYLIGVLAPSLFFLGTATAAPIGSPMAGLGTADYPYRITTCAQLQDMNQNVDAYYVLMNDINCSATSGWNGGLGFQPVGDGDGIFHGHLDGRNHTINNLAINRPAADHVALFGILSGASVNNLKLAGANITGRYYVAGISGENFTTDFNYVSFNGVLNGQISVAGLSGYTQDSSITNSSVTGTVTNTVAWGGGISAQMVNTDVISSYVNATITGGNTSGGITGYAGNTGSNSTNILGSYFAGSLTDGNYQAGLIGIIHAINPGQVYVVNNFVAANLHGGSVIYGRKDGGTKTPFVADNYFDATLLGSETSCAGGSPLSGCTAANVGNATPNIWQLGDHSAPLNAWTFNSANWSDSSGYPVLNDVTPVDLLPFGPPDAPSSFNSIPHSNKIDLSWEEPANGGHLIQHYTVQYKKASSHTWKTWSPKPTGLSVTISGLSENTEYDFRVSTTTEAGTSAYSDPYSDSTQRLNHIKTCTDLANIADSLNEDYILDHDINCTATQHTEGGFVDISGSFTGELNGNGKKIYGLAMSTDTAGGIFTALDNAYIHDLTIDAEPGGSILGDNGTGVLAANINGGTYDNVTISTDVTSTSGWSGLFAGTAACSDTDHNLSISNVSTSGNLITAGSSGYGGLIGYASLSGGCELSIDQSSSSMHYWNGSIGNEDFLAGSQVGGLIGGAEVDGNSILHINQSHFSGTIKADYSLGGLIGATNLDYTGADTNPIKIIDSYNTGEIVGDHTDDGYVGGIIGDAEEGNQIINSYSTGAVSGPAYVGGLVGYSNGDSPDVNGLQIVKSYATGPVTNNATENGFGFGGLVGQGYHLIIKNSYYNGTIDLAHGYYGGGLTSYLTGDIVNSYSAGTMIGDKDHAEYIGGLAGEWDSTDTTAAVGIYNSFSAMKITGNLDINSNVAGAVVGYDSGMPNLATNYFDPVYTGMPCGVTSEIAAEDCGHATTASFKNSTTHPPLNNWSFTNTWAKQCDNYPLLKWQGISCAEASDSSAGSSSDAEALATSDLSIGESDTNDSSSTHKIFLNDFDSYFGDGKLLKDLQIGQVIYFDVDKDGTTEHHTATVKEIGQDYAVFVIHSKAYKVKVNLGEAQMIDLGGGNFLKITLNAINGQSVDATFAQITPAGAPAAAIQKATSNWVYVLVAVGLLAAIIVLSRHNHHTKPKKPAKKAKK